MKSGAELEGMRRAQRAAEAGMETARAMLGDALAGGKTITVEEIKAAILQRFLELGASADELIVSHGPQSAIGHDAGFGRDPARRADRDRPLPARQRVRLSTPT